MYYLRNFDKQADAVGQKAYLPTIAIVGGVNKVGYFNGEASKDNVFTENDDFINVGEKETRLVCTYNVSSTTEATQLLFTGLTLSEIASMEVDGVNTTVATGYTFTTTGEHTVKFTFKDNTSIGDKTFQYCTMLTSVVIPDSVTSIGNSAFQRCSGLTSVVIPDSVTSIGNSPFNGCAGLTSVTIGSGVTSIGSYAFANCSSLTSVTIGSGVTSIDYNAFRYCTSLTSVVIPDSVTSIGSYAFANCSSLISVTIGSGVTNIADRAFYDTPWYKSYSADTANQYGNIVYINNVAYQATSTGITSCNFKEGTVSIGDCAFSGCTSLTSVVIPDSVTSIGDYAFGRCSKLATINYTGTIAQWKTITTGIGWHDKVKATTVTCTDGDVTL